MYCFHYNYCYKKRHLELIRKGRHLAKALLFKQGLTRAKIKLSCPDLISPVPPLAFTLFNLDGFVFIFVSPK